MHHCQPLRHRLIRYHRLVEGTAEADLVLFADVEEAFMMNSIDRRMVEVGLQNRHGIVALSLQQHHRLRYPHLVLLRAYQ